jgi:bacterioferritin-associated ferredoxin
VIICHCMRVNDRLIRSVVREGARTCEQVAEACGAGACCGGCRPAIDEIVREERQAPEIRFVQLSVASNA